MYAHLQGTCTPKHSYICTRTHTRTRTRTRATMHARTHAHFQAIFLMRENLLHSRLVDTKTVTKTSELLEREDECQKIIVTRIFGFNDSSPRATDRIINWSTVESIKVIQIEMLLVHTDKFTSYTSQLYNDFVRQLVPAGFEPTTFQIAQFVMGVTSQAGLCISLYTHVFLSATVTSRDL